MAKSILISIKPRYVADILNHKKTIEVRKSMPKCDLPIDVYIYCTKDKERLVDLRDDNFYLGGSERLNGKVVAKFTLNKVEEIYYTYLVNARSYSIQSCLTARHFERDCCLGQWEIEDYLKGKKGYAWYISNLVIFDKPKELSEFWHYNPKEKHYRGFPFCDFALTTPPQSYCYVETEVLL